MLRRVPSPTTSYLFPAVLPFTALVFSQVPVWFLVGMGLTLGVPRDGEPGPELQLCSTKAFSGGFRQPHAGPARQVHGLRWVYSLDELGTGRATGPGRCLGVTAAAPGLGGPPWTPLQRPRRRIKRSPEQLEPARSSPGRLGPFPPPPGPTAQPGRAVGASHGAGGAVGLIQDNPIFGCSPWGSPGVCLSNRTFLFQ